jgi:flagellin-like hook-associated protein FlgL
MAINDISLTSSMRSNLINLQTTATLLGRTQERLSTGKRVNSALDDPTSFFTAKQHMNDASDLASLKNGMSEAVQTVKKADAGVSAISTLIASAKALANTAKATSDAGSIGSADKTKLTIDTNLVGGEVVTVGGTAYTAVAAISGDGSTEFVIGSSASETAMNLAALVNDKTETDNFTASANGSVVTLTHGDGTDIVAGDVLTGAATITEVIQTGTASGRAGLSLQYDEIMSQISKLVADSGYNGVNLLGGTTETMTVDFGNSNTLTVTGFDGTGALDGTTSTNWDASTGYVTNINADIALLDAASDALEVGSQNLANNLSIVTARQEWSTEAINVLTTGADSLTLADMNEEGANMLMLQTRQSLSTTSLSLASQASQAVLRLFG